MKKLKIERPEPLITLKVNKEVHSRIKQHCKDNDYYMHAFVEEIVNQYFDNLKETI